MFKKAILNVTPIFELKSIAKGKKALLYPVLIKNPRRLRLAIKLFKKSIFIKKQNCIYNNLFFILINISLKIGEIYQKFIGNNKLIEKNRVNIK